MSKVLEPLKDYISFKDFIMKLSATHDEPIRDVVTFLVNIGFDREIDLYLVDSYYQLTRVNSTSSRAKLKYYLDKLQTDFFFDEFIYTKQNFDLLTNEDYRKASLIDVFFKGDATLPPYSLYFKKQDLVDYESLREYVNFLGIEPTPKEYPLIYKNDYFDLAECESVITGYDPNDNWQCSERDQAYRLIQSSLNNGLFELDDKGNYIISADNFRAWLISKEIFIDGFTNKTSTPDKFGKSTVTQTASLTDAELMQKVSSLQNDLSTANHTITILQSQLQQAIADRDNLQSQLDTIGQTGDVNTPAVDVSKPFFDENNIYTYPPELDMALKIWCDIYHGKDITSEVYSHTELFNRSVKKLGFDLVTKYENTGKEPDNTKRIRRVTTPKQNKDKTRN